MQNAALLQCQGVSKYFGALAAVKDLDFDAHAGEVLGIGGPNGAGKTTLFDVITGLSPCSAGKVLLGGQPIERLSPDQICRLGVARTFQLNAGFDTLSVRENILTCAYFGRRGRTIPGIFFDRETHRRADEVISFVGLEDFSGTEARSLPVFQRKLLMIAAALSTEPRLLFLDEPVGGLTVGEMDRIFDLVERIRQMNVTLVLIEHVMRFLLQLSDRVLILNRGEKIFEGKPETLTSDRDVVELFLGKQAARAIDEQRHYGQAQ